MQHPRSGILPARAGPALSRRSWLYALAAVAAGCREPARPGVATPRGAEDPPAAPRPGLPVFYDPRQHTDANESFSPSAGKPAKVVESWQALGIPLRIEAVEPAAPATIARAHAREYVDGVLALRVDNGFGNRSPEVAATLPWTVGSLVSAAAHVARRGGVAVSPTSGFHHAHHDHGGGFCTFNGLMVAVLALQDRGLARRVGILDCDVHYGDGTADILTRLGVPGVHHWTFGGEYGDEADGEPFLRGLPGVLAGFAGCDVVLYQAGADPFIDDPLGGVLTADQLRRRDELVFGHFAAAGIPLAWNLAGGYTRDAAGTIRPVLDIHDTTLRACHAAYAQTAGAA
jgi:acetoin utilization deacetylase AcuC-like enzyme